MSIIAFDDVHRAYKRGVDVLHGVSFSLEPGEVVGLLGKNGAGKTTLMSIAMGMLKAQRGSEQLIIEEAPRVTLELGWYLNLTLVVFQSFSKNCLEKFV